MILFVMMILLLLGGTIMSINAYAITDEQIDSLSNMSGKTTQQIEELVFLTSPNGKINESDWVGGNYNITSICKQLIKRSDVSAQGFLGCGELLGVLNNITDTN